MQGGEDGKEEIMERKTKNYTVTYHVGITPDNPTGIYEEERTLVRYETNEELKTSYKEAAVEAIGYEYIDWSMSEEDFRREHRRILEKQLLDEKRGGVAWGVSQEKWLEIVGNVSQRVDSQVESLWNSHH